MEKFALGMLLGGVGGALLVANNYKMRTLVRKTQEEVQCKFEKIMDDKIQEMEMTEEAKAEAEKEMDKKSKKAKDK